MITLIPSLLAILGDLTQLIEPKETRIRNKIDEILKSLKEEIYAENYKDYIVDDLLTQLREQVKKLTNQK